MRQHFFYLIFGCLFATLSLSAQGGIDEKKTIISGSVQSDVLIPQKDTEIGTEDYKDWGLTNTYADLRLMSKYIDAGARLEYLKHPLPGFEPDFKGWGVPHIYVKGHVNKLELTVGNFYDQFGSGFIFRTYEERSLGIDNSLLGAHLLFKPYKGIRFKALSGKQRRYWKLNNAWVSGSDVELDVDQWIQSMGKSNIHLTLGASFVNKNEKKEDIFADPTHKLNLPQNVNSWDVRAHLQTGGLSFLAEYARKSQDPSFDNGYIYRKGNVAMLSTSYSKRGMSLLLQAKRSDNMSFRSRRSMTGTSSFINHLPAFTQDQTYALAAMYPYATQPDGEWAYQASFGYNFKRRTFLGGRYGTKLKINYSHVHGIDKQYKGLGNQPATTLQSGSDGYTSSFWKWGEGMYYQDLNIRIDKRVSRDFNLHLMYMNQFYNKTVVEGEGGMVHSDIFIADGSYNFTPQIILRGEAQYLATKDDKGNWVFGLLELSLAPHLMITVSDEYNSGETKLHYYQGLVTYNLGAHRIQLGYGRTRAGFNCSGGVCRYVPASKGVTFSYNYNF